MRIHSLRIKNFRSIENLELTDIPTSGVVLIHGNNEAGKSSIVEALHLLLEWKHSSTAEKIKNTRPAGRDVAPEVEAEISIGSTRFRIFKRFLNQKRAELNILEPKRSQYAAGDAETKLIEILSTVDSQLRRALFLKQDDVGEALAAGGIAPLTSVLAQAQGEEVDLDSADTDALMATVAKEYQQYFTPKGQKNSAYKQALTAFEQARESAREAEVKLNALQGYVESVASYEALRDDAVRDLPSAEEELLQAQKEVSQGKEMAEKANRLDAEYQRCCQERERAEVSVEKRREDRQEVAQLSERLELLDLQLDEACQVAEAESATLAELITVRERAQQVAAKAEQSLQSTRIKLKMLQDFQRYDALQGLLEQLRALNERISDLNTQAARTPATDNDVRAVEELTQKAAVARALRDQSTPKMDFSADPATEIIVGGESITLGKEARTIELTDATTLTIGAVTATFRAGTSTTAQERAEQAAAADKALNHALAQHGVSNLEELRAARDAHREVRSQLDNAQQEKSLLLGASKQEELEREYAHLHAEIEECERPAGASAENVEEAAKAVKSAEDEFAQANAALKQAQAQVEPWLAKPKESAYLTLKAQHSTLGEQRDSLEAKLAKEAEAHSDEALQETLLAATAAESTLKLAWEEQNQVLSAMDLAGLQAKVESAQTRVKSISERLSNAREELARLDGFIRQAEGVADEVQRTQAQEEIARRQYESLERRAKAAQRLYETMQRHLNSARERYAQPFAEDLAVLAGSVFGPDVEFNLDENLKVTDRTIKDVTVPLAALSGGAKEQLAILTRFAIARLVARGGGETVPVIVDDALGSTDELRLQKMCELFNRVGHDTQVIVLTCMPKRFDWVSSKKLYSVDQLKANTLL